MKNKLEIIKYGKKKIKNTKLIISQLPGNCVYSFTQVPKNLNFRGKGKLLEFEIEGFRIRINSYSSPSIYLVSNNVTINVPGDNKSLDNIIIYPYDCYSQLVNSLDQIDEERLTKILLMAVEQFNLVFKDQRFKSKGDSI